MSIENSCLLTQKGPFSVQLVFQDRLGSFQLVKNSKKGDPEILYKEKGYVADLPYYSDIPKTITDQWEYLTSTNNIDDNGENTTDYNNNTKDIVDQWEDLTKINNNVLKR